MGTGSQSHCPREPDSWPLRLLAVDKSSDFMLEPVLSLGMASKTWNLGILFLGRQGWPETACSVVKTCANLKTATHPVSRN